MAIPQTCPQNHNNHELNTNINPVSLGAKRHPLQSSSKLLLPTVEEQPEVMTPTAPTAKEQPVVTTP